MNAASILPPTGANPKPSFSACQFLRDQVEKYFLDFAVEAEVTRVGLKYRSFQGGGPFGANRVCFVPGIFDGTVDKGGKARSYGTISRRTENSASVINPRELAELERTITICIWGPPPEGDDPTAEDIAYVNAEILLQEVIRGFDRATLNGKNVSAAVQFGELFINAPPVETGFGVEFLWQIVVAGPFFDRVNEVAYTTPAVNRGNVK